jgi:hypothetical protein
MNRLRPDQATHIALVDRREALLKEFHNEQDEEIKGITLKEIERIDLAFEPPLIRFLHYIRGLLRSRVNK